MKILNDLIETLQAENKKLRDALGFYNMIIPVLDYHYKNTQWEIKL